MLLWLTYNFLEFIISRHISAQKDIMRSKELKVESLANNKKIDSEKWDNLTIYTNIKRLGLLPT